MPKPMTGDRPELKPVNVGAAAIDIGSKLHMAAVNPACTDIPVREFGTFTQDLHHARKTNRSLPSDNPADAVDWNVEERRNTGMGSADLKGWFAQLAALDNPVRREFHLFTLLCGSRPAALQEARPEHIDFRRRTLHIPKPKGGKKKAFDIPLSRQMVFCLIRAIRFGRQRYPLQAQEWVFPADSTSGHLAETKEDREMLSKWGNDLRQTFRTIATAAGVSEVDAKLLMNHAIPGVNAGYITRHKLLEDHLRSQQQAISSAVYAALSASIAQDHELRGWLGRGAYRRATRAPISGGKQRVVRPVSQIEQGSM